MTDSEEPEVKAPEPEPIRTVRLVGIACDTCHEVTPVLVERSGWPENMTPAEIAKAREIRDPHISHSTRWVVVEVPVEKVGEVK